MVEPAPLYRVVQWATGNIGSRSLRHVIEHPELELVGLYVHSEDKEGRDAGELCGLGVTTGVLATRSIDDVLALEPDCVLYMQQGCDYDEICLLLEAGANIVTTRGEFHHPGSIDSSTRERVEAACVRGKTSIHSTGSSPGFITEALPIVLTSIQRHLDGYHIHEFADMSSRNSPDLIFNIMGFGRDPSVFDQRRWTHGADAFGPSLRVLGEALGLPLDSVESSGAVATATRTLEIAAGNVEKGTVAAQQMRVSGMRDGKALLTFTANWYLTKHIDADWDLGHTGWRVVVDGDCPLDIEMRFSIPPERMAETTPGYTANRAVNSVSVVCEAPPGIQTSVDLPQIIARLGDGSTAQGV